MEVLFVLKLATVILSAVIVITLISVNGITTNTAKAENTNLNCPKIIKAIKFYRQSTWQLQTKLGKTKVRAADVSFYSCKYAVWVADLWRSRSKKLYSRYIQYSKKLARLRELQSAGSITSDWRCIHSYEGSWDANTGNGYYGGLQMDSTFEHEYGAEFVAKWGDANNWPAYAQIIAAVRARDGYGSYHARGYWPWPNSARLCGLL